MTVRSTKQRSKWQPLAIAVFLATGLGVGDRALAQTATCSAAELSQLNPPYRCITPEMFKCIRKNNASFGGSAQYRGNTEGEIIIKSDLAGPVAVLNFRFDEPAQVFDLSVKRKMNSAVTDQQIWAGFKDTVMKCRQRS